MRERERFKQHVATLGYRLVGRHQICGLKLLAQNYIHRVSVPVAFPNLNYRNTTSHVLHTMYFEKKQIVNRIKNHLSALYDFYPTLRAYACATSNSDWQCKTRWPVTFNNFADALIKSGKCNELIMICLDFWNIQRTHPLYSKQNSLRDAAGSAQVKLDRPFSDWPLSRDLKSKFIYLFPCLHNVSNVVYFKTESSSHVNFGFCSTPSECDQSNDLLGVQLRPFCVETQGWKWPLAAHHDCRCLI